MPDQAELDRLMAQSTGGAPAVPPDPSLIALAQDAVTANQPLPGAVPAGVAAPAAPDPVDAALAAAQAPPAAPGAPGEAPPLARQIPDGSAQVAPGTSLGAEGPVMTPQDAGAQPIPRWEQPAAPGAVAGPGTTAPGAPPSPGPGDMPPVPGALRPGFPEASQQAARAEQLGARAAASETAIGDVKAAENDDKIKAHQQVAEEIRRQAEEREVIEKAKLAAVADAQKVVSAADAKLANFSYHDYFGTHKDENGNEVQNPGGNKTLARVFSFISGFNVGAYGAPDIAYRNITKGIEMDMQRQKAELALAQDRSAIARKGASDAASMFDMQLNMIDLKHAALLKATAEEAEAFAMQKGGAEEMARAKAIGDKLMAGYAEKRAETETKIANDRATLAMAGAHLQLARQTAAENADIRRDALSDKKDKAAAVDADKASASEIRDVDGNVIGHAPMVGTRLNPEVAHADNRNGNAKALIGAFDELKADVATNGNNLIPGTVNYRNRERLIANIQAAKRVAEQLPASEGGLHLEESQMPGSGSLFGLSTSPELIDKTIAGIRDKVNTQNKAIVHPQPGEKKDAPTPSGAPKAGNAGAAPSPPPDLLSLALQAVDDPDATPKQKANAKQLIIQAKKDGRL